MIRIGSLQILYIGGLSFRPQEHYSIVFKAIVLNSSQQDIASQVCLKNPFGLFRIPSAYRHKSI